jgi:uncharacterized protein YciI
VTDEGLTAVRKFSKLKKLSLFKTAVTDDCLKHLEKLASLEVLIISGSKVSEEGTRAISKALPKVRFTENT